MTLIAAAGIDTYPVVFGDLCRLFDWFLGLIVLGGRRGRLVVHLVKRREKGVTCRFCFLGAGFGG